MTVHSLRVEAVAGRSSGDDGSLDHFFPAALEGSFILARTARDAEVLRTIGDQLRQLVSAAITSAHQPPSPDAAATKSRQPSN